MGGALDMGTHLINNVVDPASAQDAATKNYVDSNSITTTSADARYVRKNGSINETVTGIKTFSFDVFSTSSGAAFPPATNTVIFGRSMANLAFYVATTPGGTVISRAYNVSGITSPEAGKLSVSFNVNVGLNACYPVQQADATSGGSGFGISFSAYRNQTGTSVDLMENDSSNNPTSRISGMVCVGSL